MKDFNAIQLRILSVNWA